MRHGIASFLVVMGGLGLGGCSPGDGSSMGDGGVQIRCNGVEDCDDESVCTTDTCESQRCVFTPVSVASACNDGDGCSTDDHCEEGACVGTGACASSTCATDALEDFLTSGVACLPHEVVSAALPTYLQRVVVCDEGIAPCSTGCPVLVTTTATATYSPAAFLGDADRLLAEVEVNTFELRFHAIYQDTGNFTDCTFRATASNGPATMTVTHDLAAAQACGGPSSDSSATTTWSGTQEDITVIAAPGPGTSQTQAECDDLAGTFTPGASTFEGMMRAWATWATPNCRNCGGCDGQPSCMVRVL